MLCSEYITISSFLNTVLYLSNVHDPGFLLRNVPVARYEDPTPKYSTWKIKLPVELGLEYYPFIGTIENGSPIHYEPGQVKKLNITLLDYLFE